MEEIPAISFIRIGNSLIDENCYLDNDDMNNIKIINYYYSNNSNSSNNSSKIIKQQASSVYHAILQKKYQQIKNSFKL
jgi:hypothetical protein